MLRGTTIKQLAPMLCSAGLWPGQPWPEQGEPGQTRPSQGLKPSYVTKGVGGWILVRITPVMQNILKNSLLPHIA